MMYDCCILWNRVKKTIKTNKRRLTMPKTEICLVLNKIILFYFELLSQKHSVPVSGCILSFNDSS